MSRERATTTGTRGWLPLVAFGAAWGLCLPSALVTGTLAFIGYTGCLVSCRPAEPLLGVLWTALTVVLLLIPFGVGAFLGRRR